MSEFESLLYDPDFKKQLKMSKVDLWALTLLSEDSNQATQLNKLEFCAEHWKISNAILRQIFSLNYFCKLFSNTYFSLSLHRSAFWCGSLANALSHAAAAQNRLIYAKILCKKSRRNSLTYNAHALTMCKYA